MTVGTLFSRSSLLSISHRMQREVLPGYLAATKAPSSRIDDPKSSRKFLILDLNGSILYRPTRHKKLVNGVSKQTVIPRPYLPSFCEYLFHDRVREWLDIMVWSSAQPHNVDNMVESCFGQKRGELMAVWARDTLDLDPRAYSAKSVTVKDLGKIWNKFPEHSASSTMLVDDSSRKARLQPWNHICIQEYAQSLRAHDLEVWKTVTTFSASSSSKKRTKRSETTPDLQPQSDPQVTELTTLVSGVELSSSPSSVSTRSRAPKADYDETLLALIGILEDLKYESNVSSWIRHGGLSRAGDSEDQEIILSGTDMWFENAKIANRWARKGKKVLKELSIQLTPGVHG